MTSTNAVQGVHPDCVFNAVWPIAGGRQGVRKPAVGHSAGQAKRHQTPVCNMVLEKHNFVVVVVIQLSVCQLCFFFFFSRSGGDTFNIVGFLRK